MRFGRPFLHGPWALLMAMGSAESLFQSHPASEIRRWSLFWFHISKLEMLELTPFFLTRTLGHVIDSDRCNPDFPGLDYIANFSRFFPRITTGVQLPGPRSLFLMTTILKLGKAAEAGSVLAALAQSRSMFIRTSRCFKPHRKTAEWFKYW